MPNGRVYQSQEVRRHQRRIIIGMILQGLAITGLACLGLAMCYLCLWAAFHGGA